MQPNAVRILLFVYAAFLIIGGVLGFLEKGSVISLIAGGLSGIMAGVGAYIFPTNRTLGLGLGLMAAVLVLGGQLPRFLAAEHKKIWPGGLTIGASIVVLAVTGIALLQGKSNP